MRSRELKYLHCAPGRVRAWWIDQEVSRDSHRRWYPLSNITLTLPSFIAVHEVIEVWSKVKRSSRELRYLPWAPGRAIAWWKVQEVSTDSHRRWYSLSNIALTLPSFIAVLEVIEVWSKVKMCSRELKYLLWAPGKMRSWWKLKDVATDSYRQWYPLSNSALTLPSFIGVHEVIEDWVRWKWDPES
jgi:hypothetical protein